jgi:hypothetical protein
MLVLWNRLVAFYVVLLFTVISNINSAPREFVYYERFGAQGDGVTDDFEAICRAHEYANNNGLPVKANSQATYYICH